MGKKFNREINLVVPILLLSRLQHEWQFCRYSLNNQYKSRNEYLRSLFRATATHILNCGLEDNLPDLGGTGYLPFYLDRDTLAIVGTLEANGIRIGLHELTTRSLYRHFLLKDQRANDLRRLIGWLRTADPVDIVGLIRSKRFEYQSLRLQLGDLRGAAEPAASALGCD